MNKDKTWNAHFKKLWKNKTSRYSLIIISSYIFVFILASVSFSKYLLIEKQEIYDKDVSLLELIYNPSEEESYSAPLSKKQLTGEDNKTRHIAGTNINGEDVFLNGLLAVRTAFIIGIGTILLVLPLAIFFGMTAGYFGKAVDMTITYTYSTLASIPGILLLIVLVKINLFKDGLYNLCFALGITSWVGLS